MIHGLGGHCARFEELALSLTALGGFTFANDHRKNAGFVDKDNFISRRLPYMLADRSQLFSYIFV